MACEAGWYRVKNIPGKFCRVFIEGRNIYEDGRNKAASAESNSSGRNHGRPKCPVHPVSEKGYSWELMAYDRGLSAEEKPAFGQAVNACKQGSGAGV